MAKLDLEKTKKECRALDRKIKALEKQIDFNEMYNKLCESKKLMNVLPDNFDSTSFYTKEENRYMSLVLLLLHEKVEKLKKELERR